MIEVAVIGAGYIGGVHLDALRRLGEVHVSSVFDVDPSLAKKAANEHGVAHVAESLDQILADPAIKAVHLCTPNKFHFEQSMRVLDAGKDVFSEKPLALNAVEARQLARKAKDTGAITGVGFCYRYYPLVQEMAQRIRGGKYGAVRLIHGTWFQDWLSEMTDYSWRLEKEQSGESNVAADLGSHWLDLVQFVTGLDVSEVFADFHTIIPERYKPAGPNLAFQKSGIGERVKVAIEVEDYATILFRLKNGTVPGSLSTSQVCPGRKSETAFEIYCAEGSLAWNHKRSDELWIGHRHGPNETLIENPNELAPALAQYATLPAGHPLGYRDAVLNMLRHYYEAVASREEGDGRMRPTFATGLVEMELLEAVLQSCKARAWVTT